MARIKVAVVGAGILGSRHARVFHEHAEAEMVAVVDIDETRARRVAERSGARVYTNLGELLAGDAFDALAVATPDHLHREPAVAALARGKHVFLEKPLATTRADVDAITAASGRSGAVAMVNYSQRFVPEYAAIKRIVEDGTIGRPAMVTSHKFDTIHVPTAMIGWAAQTSPFFFMSSHDLDLVRWYVGRDPVEVVARERRGVLEAAGVPVHDGLNVLISFGAEVMANFHASWIHPTSYPVVADGFLQIIGSSGTLMLDNRARRLVVYGPKGCVEQVFSGPHTANEVDGKIVGAFTDSVTAFLTAIRNGSEPELSVRRTLPIAEAQLAAVEALKTGAAVRIV
ncbi:MAG: Gfo/Idh/MocA family oxidoreductase [Proteobacteria bacterium]|nr:Gfo/Idh/MocA family oxidoreductase [Pseudomonadota bacterium]MBI3496439.1 Gfo/Idh/MocA family oxidoreductase [Pseudomonadota bacterium]